MGCRILYISPVSVKRELTPHTPPSFADNLVTFRGATLPTLYSYGFREGDFLEEFSWRFDLA